MIASVREDAKRRKLASAAVLAFAVGGLVLSWVSARATTLDLVTISAPALGLAGRRDTPTNLSLQRIKMTAHVGFSPVTLGNAERSVQPQVDTTPARARSDTRS
jgi:alpha-beta hydrolase superfamily lysophospholipase